MPRFLRSITRSRWDTYPDIPWLELGQLKADVFRDLSTTDGLLSIWEVPEGLTAERIAVAMAATRDNLGPMDIVVFDDLPLQLDVVPDRAPGDTPDAEVNSFHYDMRHLTVQKLLALAMHMSGGAYTRLPLRQVETGLRDGIRDGHLTPAGLRDSLRLRLSI
jgi:hypothetical protein